MQDKPPEPVFLFRRLLTTNKDIHAIIVKLKDVPGALMQVLNVLQKYQINILGVTAFSFMKQDGYGNAFIVTDCSNSHKKIKDVVEEISKQPLVINSIKLERPVPVLVIDTYHYPIMISGELKGYIFTQPLIERTMQGGAETFGIDAMQSFLWYIGKAVGKDMAKTWLNYGLKKEEVPIGILWTGQSLGQWKGSLNQDLTSGKVEIIFHDNFECSNKKGLKQKSSFVRGVWEAIYEVILERKVTFEEVSCIALGDEQCVFRNF